MGEIYAGLIISWDCYECMLGGSLCLVITCLEITEKKCSLCGNACAITHTQDRNRHSPSQLSAYKGL